MLEVDEIFEAFAYNITETKTNYLRADDILHYPMKSFAINWFNSAEVSHCWYPLYGIVIWQLKYWTEHNMKN